MDPSPLAVLERAELAARERRLAAGAEAERMLADAAARVASIESETPDRVASALGNLRSTHESRASAEVVAIERELASLDARPRRPGTDAAFTAAVELVVAAVLGEAQREDPERPARELAAASATTTSGGAD